LQDTAHIKNTAAAAKAAQKPNLKNTNQKKKKKRKCYSEKHGTERERERERESAYIENGVATEAESATEIVVPYYQDHKNKDSQHMDNR
jgi:hypothetical protein